MIKVGLVQINNTFSGYSYLPYSVGLLQAYVLGHSKDPSRFNFKPPVYERKKVIEIVDQVADCDVVAFSTYVWNINISLAVAKLLKQWNPKIYIIFGGPQVPNNSEDFLRKNKYVDIVIRGEGERAFCKLLDELPLQNPTSVESTAYLFEGRYIENPFMERIKNLDEIPSPFLNDIFKPLMERDTNTQWLMSWETNRGCPFSCTFCDWGSATAAKVFQFGIDRLKKEIVWASDKKLEFIFCCDANFGILKRDLDIAQAVVDSKNNTGYPKVISVQNTKNATERAYAVQKLLSDNGLNKGVTISMQSVDPTTLEYIKRDNISTDSFKELQSRFMADKVETYTDVILALPGETLDSLKNGISSIIDNGQHNRIQFNNLSILPNAEMGDPEYQKKFGMITVESDIINIHGSLSEEEEIKEKQLLVIGTNSMPKEDWVKARAYCWLVALLYFDKVCQIPIVITKNLAGVSYRNIFDKIAKSITPRVKEIMDFFYDEATAIQNGKVEYVARKDCLNMYWTADESAYIDLIKKKNLMSFYNEILAILLTMAPGYFNEIGQACHLNLSMLKMPFSQSQDITSEYNIFEVYKKALAGESTLLVKRKILNKINDEKLSWNSLDDWLREVVWYGNKRGAYLYSNTPEPFTIAGHY